MLRKLFLSALFVFAGLTGAFAAKNTCVLTGKVTDAVTKEGVAYATIAVRNAEETVIAAGTSLEDGTFSVPNIPFGTYAVEVSYMGYKMVRKDDVKLDVPQFDLGETILEEDAQTLATAVITARVPVIEQKIDKIVMNVAEAVSTQGSNALDVLRKAPGVTVDMDGNVKLNGQAVSVWIDGRPSYLSGLELEALLRSTDGPTIDKIELMANPSAKYDAEGSGGIINIKMKRNVLQGFNGMVNGTYGGMQFDRYLQEATGGVNLNYRSTKTNTMFNYSGMYNGMTADLISSTKMADTGISQEANSDFLIESKSHTIKLAHDYFINKKHTVGAIFNAMLSDQVQDNYGDDNLTKLFFNGNLLSSQNSIIQTHSDYNNVMGNLNYTGLFNEKTSQELTVNLDYAYYDILSYNYQDNSFLNAGASMADNIFRQNGKQYINLLSGKADFQQTIWTNGSLEYGIKWAMTQTNNDLMREDFFGGWKPNDTFSNKFNYSEQIAAAYVSFGKMFGAKWMAKLGLRGEYTYAVGDWITAKDKSTKSYFNVFPTVFLGYNPSPSWRMTLSYTDRITRPSFSQLNPFRTYIDANSYTEGNPDLDPQFSNQLMLGVGFKNHYNLTIIGAHTRNLIMQNPYYDPETAGKLLLMENFGTQNMIGGAFSISELPVFKWMTFTLSATGLYTMNESLPDSEKGQVNNNGWVTQGYGQLTFLLPKDFKVELNALVTGPMPQGYFVIQPMFFSGLGVKKTFMENRATLSLNVNDIFRTLSTNLKYNLENIEYDLQQKINFQKISLSFSYRFGQSKASRTRNVGNLEEASRAGSSGGISTGVAGGTGGLN